MMNEEPYLVTAEFIAKRWQIDTSTVRRKLSHLAIRLGGRKGNAIRYAFKDIVNLETEWKGESR